MGRWQCLQWLFYGVYFLFNGGLNDKMDKISF